jgi:hypothetical protein
MKNLSELDQTVTLQTCIMMTGSIRGRDTDGSDGGFPWFYAVHPSKLRSSALT